MQTDKDVYVGERNDDGEPHGKGKKTYADGAVYDGEWVEGLRHGHGKLTYANGRIKEGQWVHSAFVNATSATEDNADAGTEGPPAGWPDRGAQKRKRSGAERRHGGEKAMKKKGGFVDFPAAYTRKLEGLEIRKLEGLEIRKVEGLDIWIVMDFASTVLGADPQKLLVELETLPERRAGDAITWAEPQWVEGDNQALHYRGNALKRGKIWLQRDDPETHGFLKYFYTGWQWRVLPATACVDKCEPVKATMYGYDAFCDKFGAQRSNHTIVTRYRDGEHCITAHFDKPKSIAPSTDALKSLITVVKLGQHGRPFTLAMRETPMQPFFNEVLPPGTAVIMTLEANLQTVHAVPAVAESGPSGSIVFRTITQRVPWAEAEREVTKRGGARAAIDPEDGAEVENVAASASE